MTAEPITAPTPYADHAMAYLKSGWSPVPVPYGQKAPVPTGWTGASGAFPSSADVWAWTEEQAHSNVALRLPKHVIGIDVDNYDSKPGGAVLLHLESQLGALPATWRCTSRDDGYSGIRFYRVPEGLRWPGGLGPGIDTIRYDHRYAVAPPSLHPTGRPYLWIDPSGATVLGARVIPDVASLPELPAAWVDHFTGGELSSEQPHAGLDYRGAQAWKQARDVGAPCIRMTSATNKAITELARMHEGGRHDTALKAINQLVWLAGEGHCGLGPVLADLRQAYFTAVGKDRTGLEGEWERMVDGAVQIAAAAHAYVPQGDPCINPFIGLLDRSTPCPPMTSSPATHAATVTVTESSPSTSWATPALTVTVGDLATAHAAAATSGEASVDSGSAANSAATSAPSRERTTWWPRDNAFVLDPDSDPEPPPAWLARSDGELTFYNGKVNGIIGPSESGKSWLALEAVKQAITAGRRVTYIDFEDGHAGIVARLLLLGVTRDQVAEQFAYMDPQEALRPLMDTKADLEEHLAVWQPALIVVDGVNAGMNLHGLDINSNNDATSFLQQILRPLADDDRCVIFVDHTPKDADKASSGAIGAQAKRAMTTGCCILVEVVTPFGIGQPGKLNAYVNKNRQGHVRGVSKATNKGHLFAEVHILSDSSSVRIDIAVPEFFTAGPSNKPEKFRPTTLMTRVSAYLQDHPEASTEAIKRDVEGKDSTIVVAIQALVDEGWVTVSREDSGRRTKRHTSVKPFRETSDLIGDTPETPVTRSTHSHPFPPIPSHSREGVSVPIPTHSPPPPLRGGGNGNGSRGPGTGSEETTHARAERVVERTIAGKIQRVNLSTGEVLGE